MSPSTNAEALIADQVDKEQPLALYIHWPFCVSKCPYCDFNSHVRESVDVEAWRNALLADMAHEAGLTGGRKLHSIFFGGGTPSLMPPELVGALLEAADSHWGFEADIEITLEANPSSVEAARFADLALAGVNRVSLGLQALDNETLHFLGRAHDVAEGLAALDTAQAAFDRVSFDLIYARPNQRISDWHAELARALSFGTEHLSLYQLTIEPGTRFETLARRGELAEIDPDQAADLYALTAETTHTAGLPAYEISNHARTGEESRHNLIYWRYQDYAGIGPGAHGRRGGVATTRHKKPENYLSAVSRNGNGLAEEAHLSPSDQRVEAILMGLRLSEGVDLDRQVGDAPLRSAVDEDACHKLAAQGLLSQSGATLAITPQGFPVLDAILRQIVR